MKWYYFGMVFLAGLLLGAHFFRASNYGLSLVSVLFPCLLFIRRSGALLSVKVFLFTGTLIWMQTALSIAIDRKANDMPFMRAVCIIALVAVLSGLPLLFLNKRSVRSYFAARPNGQSMRNI